MNTNLMFEAGEETPTYSYGHDPACATHVETFQADGDQESAGVHADMAREAIGKDLPEEALLQVVREDVEARMLTLEANLKNLKPNLTSIEEFRKADTEYKGRLGDYEARVWWAFWGGLGVRHQVRPQVVWNYGVGFRHISDLVRMYVQQKSDFWQSGTPLKHDS